MPKAFLVLIGLLIIVIVYVYIPSINPGSIEKESTTLKKMKIK